MKSHLEAVAPKILPVNVLVLQLFGLRFSGTVECRRWSHDAHPGISPNELKRVFSLFGGDQSIHTVSVMMATAHRNFVVA